MDYYVILNEQQDDLNINQERLYDMVVAFKEEPVKNWVVGFKIVELDDTENVSAQFEVLRVPNLVSEQEIEDKQSLISQTINDIIVEVIERYLESNPIPSEVE